MFVWTGSSLYFRFNMPNKPANDENEVLKQLKVLTSNFSEFSKATSNNFEGLRDDIKAMQSDTIEVRDRIEACESAHDDLKYEVEVLKQKRLALNICITGIPAVQDEDINAIIVKLYQIVGLAFDENQLATYYRVKNSRKHSIIVQFKVDEDKRKLLAAKKVTKEILLEQLDLGFSAPICGREIMVNQHMTPFFGHLLYLGRDAVRSKELSASWFAGSGIYIKKSADDETPIFVKSPAQLSTYVVRTEEHQSKKRRAPNDNTNPRPIKQRNRQVK